jgi:hypothetical protein
MNDNRTSASYVNHNEGANIGNYANTVKDNAQMRVVQYNSQSDKEKILKDAALEIQNLLKQLEQSKPTATDSEKLDYLNDNTTPSFQRRIVGALRESSETAIDEYILESKHLKVVKAAIKGWLKPDD